MTSSNGNLFRVTGPLYGEFTGHRWIPLTKASNAELWWFLWSSPWINGWVKNREAGEFRRLRAYYDVIVMFNIRVFTPEIAITPSFMLYSSFGLWLQGSRLEGEYCGKQLRIDITQLFYVAPSRKSCDVCIQRTSIMQVLVYEKHAI